MDQRYFTPATVISEASWRTSPASAMNASPSLNTSSAFSWFCSSSSGWNSSVESSESSSWISSTSHSSELSGWNSSSASCAVSSIFSSDTSLKTSASDAIAVTGIPDAITAELKTSATDFLKSFHLCILILLFVLYDNCCSSIENSAQRNPYQFFCEPDSYPWSVLLHSSIPDIALQLLWLIDWNFFCRICNMCQSLQKCSIKHAIVCSN